MRLIERDPRLEETQYVLQTKSRYHQDVALQNEQTPVIARYIKTFAGGLWFKRQSMDDPTVIVDGHLRTEQQWNNPNQYTDTITEVIEDPKVPGAYIEKTFYRSNLDNFVWKKENELIELYKGYDDLVRFARLNARLIAEGKLIPFEDGIKYTYKNGRLEAEYEEVDFDLPVATGRKG